MKNMNLRTCINWLERKQIQEFLEGTGMAVSEDETTEDLRDTLFESVGSGDIGESCIRELVE